MSLLAIVPLLIIAVLGFWCVRLTRTVQRLRRERAAQLADATNTDAALLVRWLQSVDSGDKYRRIFIMRSHYALDDSPYRVSVERSGQGKSCEYNADADSLLGAVALVAKNLRGES